MAIGIFWLLVMFLIAVGLAAIAIRIVGGVLSLILKLISAILVLAIIFVLLTSIF